MWPFVWAPMPTRPVLGPHLSKDLKQRWPVLYYVINWSICQASSNQQWTCVRSHQVCKWPDRSHHLVSTAGTQIIHQTHDDLFLPKVWIIHYHANSWPIHHRWPVMLQSCFIDFAVEHRFSCCANEPGFAGDIGAIEIWLIDWLIDLHRILELVCDGNTDWSSRKQNLS